MNTAGEFVKFGGFLGFAGIFLFVLMRDRDVVAAVFDASVACLVLGFAFKLLYSYTIELQNQVIREKQALNQSNPKSSDSDNLKTLSDGQTES